MENQVTVKNFNFVDLEKLKTEDQKEAASLIYAEKTGKTPAAARAEIDKLIEAGDRILYYEYEEVVASGAPGMKPPGVGNADNAELNPFLFAVCILTYLFDLLQKLAALTELVKLAESDVKAMSILSMAQAAVASAAQTLEAAAQEQQMHRVAGAAAAAGAAIAGAQFVATIGSAGLAKNAASKETGGLDKDIVKQKTELYGVGGTKDNPMPDSPAKKLADLEKIPSAATPDKPDGSSPLSRARDDVKFREEKLSNDEKRWSDALTRHETKINHAINAAATMLNKIAEMSKEVQTVPLIGLKAAAEALKQQIEALINLINQMLPSINEALQKESKGFNDTQDMLTRESNRAVDVSRFRG